MSIETYIPRAPLSDYVQMFWSWPGYHPPHARERILPGGMIEIAINLADGPFRVSGDGGTMKAIRGPMAAGARSTHFMIDTSAPLSLLSVWFKPGGAAIFLGVPGHLLHNRHLPLDELWGAAAGRLHERLLAAPTNRHRFELLEHALLHRLHAARARHPAVAYALAHLHAAPPSCRIRRLVERLALSPTRFIDVFKQDVGMTPKQFVRLQRFQQALRLRTQHPGLRWADIALRCGFYDQAHLVNEFRRMGGITPTAYAPQSDEHHLNLPVDVAPSDGTS